MATSFDMYIDYDYSCAFFNPCNDAISFFEIIFSNCLSIAFKQVWNDELIVENVKFFFGN